MTPSRALVAFCTKMGFMRRFDVGYAAEAKKRIEAEGVIGTPIVFKILFTRSAPAFPGVREPRRAAGGMIVDMGIHDFDLARFFMGEVATVAAVGGTLAYPELAEVGDIDNAVVTLTFASGCIGIVDLSRKRHLRLRHLRGNPRHIRHDCESRIFSARRRCFVMTKNQVAHDTVPYFMERFRDAYTVQLQNFVDNLRNDCEPPVTIEDGIGALRIALAATKARETGGSVSVKDYA